MQREAPPMLGEDGKDLVFLFVCDRFLLSLYRIKLFENASKGFSADSLSSFSNKCDVGSEICCVERELIVDLKIL